MGTLERLADHTVIDIPADALIGRGDDHDVALQAARASAPHARLRWAKDHWELCDLASLNGSYLNDVRMTSGERARLRKGDTLRFGSPQECYRLHDAGPPTPLARHVSTGLTRPLCDDMLLLPDDDTPQACLYVSNSGAMVIEMDERNSRVVDREVVQVGTELWQIRTLMVARPATLHAPSAMSIDKLEAHFTASPSEEHVRIELLGNGQRIELKPRTFHYLLLMLARARVRDADAPPDEQGWVDRDELCRMLNTRTEVLNVDIYRARRQLSSRGVLGAPSIIERRQTSRELRIGIPHLFITE